MSSNKPLQPVKFDVLIIYSDLVTGSTSKHRESSKPFNASSDALNDVYAYLLTMCQKVGLSAAFSTTRDISGSGMCSSYWIFKNDKWKKVYASCYSQLIFDKFFPRNSLRRQQREKMFMSPDVNSFTSSMLMDIFFDKFQTYSRLSRYSIPTVAVDGASRSLIKIALSELQEKINIHENKEDFGEGFILKDRFGAGGKNIYQISYNFVEKIYDFANEDLKTSFILQPQVAFESGYQYLDYAGATEIRLIYKGKKVVQTYIRVAGKDDFICNNGSGGIWITEKDIPKKVKNVANKIAKNLDRKHAIFALDFIVSDNGNVYLLEANVSPGIDWHEESPGNKKMNQTMIGIIVEELSRRVLKDKIGDSFPIIKTEQIQKPLFL